MSNPLKVLWGAADYLRAQQFQQQDLYHESRLRQTAHALNPFLWGVQRVEWNLDSLAANKLEATALSAFFRSGDFADAPNSEPLPPPIDLAALPSEVQEITYHAALPMLNIDGDNVAVAGQQHGGARFSQVGRATSDLFTEGEVEQIRYLRKTMRLVSDREPLGAYDSFPIIKLRRTVTGGFELDPSFVPPSVAVHSAPQLAAQLKQLMEALQAKVNALLGNMREPSRNVIEFRSGDVSSFWLLHTASTAAATLTHYMHHPELHPERLFEALLGLAGALMTYSKSYTLSDLPKYQHNDLGRCFGQLDTIIRELLTTVISTKCFSIALEETKPYYYGGRLDSGKIDHATTLYLAVSAALPALELVDTVPRHIKLGGPDDLERCVLSSLSGIKLVHAARVPAAIPVQPDTYYFALDNKSVLYEQMLKAQAISLYIPDGIDDLQIELIAVTA
ncbi:type VI secretion system baseplate subunit TssK [Rugamonas rubra]|uniref:Type VI secretion system protein ImpJ n=1 Tax=Rugamonas rubra TaxID=758825 RepID=A0A1I4QSZ3_9BURK|nr:type VI secretion system baseplate subunit TssK [Rugamonas rubra]SFM42855.1 type VI secretion system protein ImpJ [Rugamonas rubra]